MTRQRTQTRNKSEESLSEESGVQFKSLLTVGLEKWMCSCLKNPNKLRKFPRPPTNPAVFRPPSSSSPRPQHRALFFPTNTIKKIINKTSGQELANTGLASCFCKWSFARTQSHPVHSSPIIYGCLVVAETMWLTKVERCTIWSYRKRCWLLWWLLCLPWFYANFI